MGGGGTLVSKTDTNEMASHRQNPEPGKGTQTSHRGAWCLSWNLTPHTDLPLLPMPTSPTSACIFIISHLFFKNLPQSLASPCNPPSTRCTNLCSFPTTGSAPPWSKGQGANFSAQPNSTASDLHNTVPQTSTQCSDPAGHITTLLVTLHLCKAIPSAWVVFPPSHGQAAGLSQLSVGPGTKQTPLKACREKMLPDLALRVSPFGWSWSRSFIVNCNHKYSTFLSYGSHSGKVSNMRES